MTLVSGAVDTAQANQYVQSGWAAKGDLIVWRRDQTLWRVTKPRNIKYLAMSVAGKEMLLPFSGCDAAPAGTEWRGQTVAPSEIRAAKRAAVAQSFSVGDRVEVNDGDPRFPGVYVIVKKTSENRFKMVAADNPLNSFTGPASLIRKVS